MSRRGYSVKQVKADAVCDYYVLTIGQEIQAKVVDFNGEDKKISLSMKALEAPAEEESVEE